MSECVVRMEMPQNCYLCDFRGSWAFCPIGKRPVVGYKKQRHEDCPIICQLPDGHGRLVDADALKEKAVHYSETEYHFDHDAVEVDDIEDAPTIVPAEGSGK